jgi:hypothetical protein
MRILSFNIKLPGFKDITGLASLEIEIQKLRELRDSYREANKEYYGEYLAALLND